MNKKLLLIGLIIGGFSFNLKAQEDIQFSQFNSVPLNINPGEAGMYKGDARLFAHYRTQWAGIEAPFKTMAASADFHLLKGKLGGSFLGLGLNFFNDQAGDSHFTTNKYNLTVSYALDLNGDGTNYLALGIQAGFMQRSIDMSDLTWESQYNGVSFDQNLPSYEATGKQATNKFDLGAGVFWKNKLSNGNNIFAGVASYHLTAPQINFLETENNYMRRYNIVAGGEFKVGGADSKTSLLPNALYFIQGPNHAFNIGTDIKFQMGQKSHYTDFQTGSSIKFGLYYRTGDALFGTFGYNWNGLGIGLSYDANMFSVDKIDGSASALEVMLSYIVKPKAMFKMSKAKIN